jgi:hypothetical protein
VKLELIHDHQLVGHDIQSQSSKKETSILGPAAATSGAGFAFMEASIIDSLRL